jgi:hypothetical protein
MLYQLDAKATVHSHRSGGARNGQSHYDKREGKSTKKADHRAEGSPDGWSAGSSMRSSWIGDDAAGGGWIGLGVRSPCELTL